jgi:hypothetical protein
VYKVLLKPKDEFDATGKAVAWKLWHMAESQRKIAEHLCNTVLCYGTQNKLQDSSYV